VFSALEVCYDNALYKFTFDIDIDIDIDMNIIMNIMSTYGHEKVLFLVCYNSISLSFSVLVNRPDIYSLLLMLLIFV